MPATRVCCSTSTSRTPRRSRRSGARSSRAATATLVARIPGLARLLEQLRAATATRQRPAQRPSPAPLARGRAAADRDRRAARRASPPRWRSSRPTACTATSRRGSTRSARSRSGDPALDPLRLEPQLTPELQARIPASVLRVHVAGRDARRGAAAAAGDLLRHDRLRDRAHLRPRAARLAAPGDRVVALPPAALAGRAARASTRASARSRGSSATCAASFLGQKQFSLEGLDVMIPMLDEALELAAAAGAHEVVIGMAHRGRLNVLAHTIGHAVRGDPARVRGRADDRGRRRRRRGRHGRRQVPPRRARARATPQPARSASRSPRTRATSRPSTRSSRAARAPSRPTARPAPGSTTRPSRCRSCIHGDAAFAGQGVVAETLNLDALDGLLDRRHAAPDHEQPGRLHDRPGRGPLDALLLRPRQGLRRRRSSTSTPTTPRRRSRRSASRSPTARRFGHDVVIDLVGYRRFGHNEQDEAAYTQPLMVEQIARHPTVRELYARAARRARASSRRRGRAARDEAAERAARGARAPEGVASARRSRRSRATKASRATRRRRSSPRVPAERLRALNEQLLRVPEGFTVHPKLARQLERRLAALDEGGIDWGHAEALAFALAARRGDPDPADRPGHRARHVLAPASRPPRRRDTGERYAPIQHLDDAQRRRSRSTTRRSPSTPASASSTATRPPRPRRSCSGRRSSATSSTARRSIIDQFIVERPREVEADLAADAPPAARLRGQRPGALERAARALPPARRAGEHPRSRTARPRRSTSTCCAARRSTRPRRPLVVMTPKGLLRLKEASSTLADLARGRVPAGPRRPGVDRQARSRRLVLCSGQGLLRHRRPRGRAPSATGVAVARLEQLYPFPVEAAREPDRRPTRRSTRSSGRRRSRRTWARGGRSATGSRRRAGERPLRYVGRPWRASPSEGYPTAHLREQDRIVRAALGV